jgi:hypothetical protein
MHEKDCDISGMFLKCEKGALLTAITIGNCRYRDTGNLALCLHRSPEGMPRRNECEQPHFFNFPGPAGPANVREKGIISLEKMLDTCNINRSLIYFDSQDRIRK